MGSICRFQHCIHALPRLVLASVPYWYPPTLSLPLQLPPSPPTPSLPPSLSLHLSPSIYLPPSLSLFFTSSLFPFSLPLSFLCTFCLSFHLIYQVVSSSKTTETMVTMQCHSSLTGIRCVYIVAPSKPPQSSVLNQHRFPPIVSSLEVVWLD